MNNNETNETSDYSSILEFLITYQLTQNYIKYAEFEYDLLNKNRFIPTDKITSFFDELSKYEESTIFILPENYLLYRARVLGWDFIERNLDEFFECYLEKEYEKHETIKQLKKLQFSATSIETIFINMLPLIRDSKEFSKNIENFISKQDFKNFNGYPPEQCLAPPPDKTQEGRLNPTNISYLYTATSVDTAIYEVKPIIGQKISVAELSTKKELKLFDLSRDDYIDISNTDNKNQMKVISIIKVIAENFERPNHNQNLNYIPTQYITEYIKEVLKFDGIKFKSSVHENGINIVLFENDCCIVKNSKIYDVDNIKISSSELKFDQE